MRTVWLLLMLWMAFGAYGAPQTLVVAFWNVENLFDTEDDPDNKGDDAYTPRVTWQSKCDQKWVFMTHGRIQLLRICI